jgi:hypothetical protein
MTRRRLILSFLAVLPALAGCKNKNASGSTDASACAVPCGGACCDPGKVCNQDELCVPCPGVICGTACCGPGEQCTNGVCGVQCNGAFCVDGGACVNGACCANPCGDFDAGASLCCPAGSDCFADNIGGEGSTVVKYGCGQHCSVSSACPSTQPCCRFLYSGEGTCYDPSTAPAPCRCKVTSECTNGENGSPLLGGTACVPVVSKGVVVAKFYICKDNSGAGWSGCNGGVPCQSGYDCWTDDNNNSICARSCNTDNDCGNVNVACCVKTAKCNNGDAGTCAGAGACLPCP